MSLYGNNIENKLLNHPCFSHKASKMVRIHLPVAQSCDINCTYCVKKYDCINESRPGVTANILSPYEALERYREAKTKYGDMLTVAAIAGPGDALSNWKETFETFCLIRKDDPNVILCLSTNGLYLSEYVDKLACLNVSAITVTVNFLSPLVGEKICSFVSYNGMEYYEESAAKLLSQKQWEGIDKCVKAGIACKINTVYLKGVNDEELPQIAKKSGKHGCLLHNIIPLIPLKGTPFSKENIPNCCDIESVRKLCGRYIQQMSHCQRCRADALGQVQDNTHA